MTKHFLYSPQLLITLNYHKLIPEKCIFTTPKHIFIKFWLLISCTIFAISHYQQKSLLLTCMRCAPLIANPLIILSFSLFYMLFCCKLTSITDYWQSVSHSVTKVAQIYFRDPGRQMSFLDFFIGGCGQWDLQHSPVTSLYSP